MIDASLLEVFLGEARTQLRLLRSPDLSPEGRRRAVEALRDAAVMSGLPALATSARRILELGVASAGSEAELARLRDAIEALAAPYEAEATEGAENDAFEEDWDPETAALLRRLFAAEAHEHLEVMTASLLQALRTPDSLQEVLRRAHTLKGSAGTVGLRHVEHAVHLLEERCIALRDGRLPVDDAAIDALLGATDLIRGMVEGTDASAEATTPPEVALGRLRQGLGAAESASAADTDPEHEEEQEPTGRQAREVGVVSLRDAGKVATGRERRVGNDRRRGEDHLIRVDVSHIDELMNSVGQLVIDRTRVERRLEVLKALARDLLASRQTLHGGVGLLRPLLEHPALATLSEVEGELSDVVANLEQATASLLEDSEALRRTTRDLQAHLTKVRMMPIRWLFARLQRPSREMARAQGKTVVLLTKGETTEMDRSIVEQITDPLIHLVRNAVAHGIESPEVRRAAGKPEAGVVEITARHQGDFLLLDVADDGAGIDLGRLRSAVTAFSGDVGAGSPLSDEELLEWIFASGVSTRAKADRHAGRGIGLDVVRQNVLALGGTIGVRTRDGGGTCFTLRVPMTTAITQAMLFKEGEQVYAIPIAHVLESVAAAPPQLRSVAGRGLELEHRGERLPVVVLSQVLGTSPLTPGGGDASNPSGERTAILVLGLGEFRFGVAVRRVIGPREIVIKGLGPLLAPLPLFSGGTVSGSGKVQLVLDVMTLAQLARRPAPGAGAGAGSLATEVDRARLSPPRLLVADDSRTVREAVAQLLRDAGYVVDLASDGWEAWEQLQRRPYDLLMTDLEMPRLDGAELIAKCRKDATLRGLPILVLSSRQAEGSRRLVGDGGADGLLAKPVNRRVVLHGVRGVMRSVAAARRGGASV
ncbi:MAG: response regulator [Deltaproteobacteria bacterium]|nr:response regulator [Deltaproteobacteria bacterium]